MNQYEHRMLHCLKKLKEEFGAFEIKAEFEAEATRQEELVRLKDITSKAGLPIIVKIGGVEAITDVYNALNIGPKAIVAPMAETAFALQKFLNLIKNNLSEDERKDTEFHFNMETITAFNNLEAMLNLPDASLLTGLTVGRVDLTGSMNLNSSHANSEEILAICEKTFMMAKEKGLKCALGGAISGSSIDFIAKLISKGLIDKFETRKVVFKADSVKNLERAINEAVNFELLWLKSKREMYSRRYSEDDARITMLENRLRPNLFIGPTANLKTLL